MSENPNDEYDMDVMTDDDMEAQKPEGQVAEPKPGTAGYDWTPHYDTDDLYTHTFADGTVVVIKSFGAIYSKTFLYKVRNLPTNDDIEFAAIDRASCPLAREILGGLDDTNGDPIDELWKAWVAAGTSRGEGDPGLTPGKSSG